VNKSGQVPLHYVAIYGFESIFDFLLIMGSQLNTATNHARPLYMASAWGWCVAAKRLIQAGADIEGRDDKGGTAEFRNTSRS
jgi:ankyrin repeat protein